jgi:hypothetical protein
MKRCHSSVVAADYPGKFFLVELMSTDWQKTVKKCGLAKLRK